tara:strand:- start:378 stop:689 length:312 start_codon:yes stop_codon:yes gene_type:complete
MRFILIILFLVSFGSIVYCSKYEKQISHLVKKYTKEESIRISSEINITGACVANKGQLINTCKGSESQKGERLGSNEPIKLGKIYYLGTYVKKLEEYKNYPNE